MAQLLVIFMALPLASIILPSGPSAYREDRVLSPHQGLDVASESLGSPTAAMEGDVPYLLVKASHLPAAAFCGSVGRA